MEFIGKGSQELSKEFEEKLNNPDKDNKIRLNLTEEQEFEHNQAVLRRFGKIKTKANK